MPVESQRSPSRPSLVVTPGKDVGVVLHRDGRVRFQRLGKDPQPAPEFRAEDFDLTADRSWVAAFTDPRSIVEMQRRADRLDDALALLDEVLGDGYVRGRLAERIEKFLNGGEDDG